MEDDDVLWDRIVYYWFVSSTYTDPAVAYLDFYSVSAVSNPTSLRGLRGKSKYEFKFTVFEDAVDASDRV